MRYEVSYPSLHGTERSPSRMLDEKSVSLQCSDLIRMIHLMDLEKKDLEQKGSQSFDINQTSRGEERHKYSFLSSKVPDRN